jgi:elongation factor P--(R)-beta-lysine ligase
MLAKPWHGGLPVGSRSPERPECFKLYACGVELANAFSELTDADEQRQHFENDRAMHQNPYGTAPVLDDDFMAALDLGLPDSSGCALGFDRRVMLAAHAEDITDVLSAPMV